MKADYLFVPACEADIDQLAALEVDLFHTDRCSRKTFRYLIRHAQVVVIKRPGDTEIFGYAILLGRKNSRKMRIYSFGIAAAARGNGLAGRLLEVLEDIVRAKKCSMLTLEVSDSNVAAIGLYKKHGFAQCGFRFGYYEDGGHAILMRKTLDETRNRQ
ncbi:MAG: acetyltransferase [uncultured bacterium]|nr:MAG: acetyltransferase [uncultured bacterium]HBG19087.1 GNAT family N-acetyltransferase [Desulfobulbaceae bacterium]